MNEPRPQVLDPMERLSEIVFGLIMAMTFTGTISAISTEREEIRTLLIGALGCNLAWGIVDACMYLLHAVSERGRDIGIVQRIRAHHDPVRAREEIAGALPPLVAALLPEASYRTLHEKLSALPNLPRRAALAAGDFKAAGGVFLLVFVSTFPLVIPFLVINETRPAVRASHAVGVLMMFFIGRSYGRISGLGAWRMGLAMVGLGLVLVITTIALGG